VYRVVCHRHLAVCLVILHAGHSAGEYRRLFALCNIATANHVAHQLPSVHASCIVPFGSLGICMACCTACCSSLLATVCSLLSGIPCHVAATVCSALFDASCVHLASCTASWLQPICLLRSSPLPYQMWSAKFDNARCCVAAVSLLRCPLIRLARAVVTCGA
jgi:hypothetical protein